MSPAPPKPLCLVSACLAGRPCRYDGTSCIAPALKCLADAGLAIPVCPEELGGLPTPRLPAEICQGRVINAQGQEVTAQFAQGAEAVLNLARRHGLALAILKARSPSCGRGPIYDGTFTRTLTPGQGITAARLQRSNILVLDEDNYAAHPAFLALVNSAQKLP